jgi:hypothetical protein
VCCRLKLDRIFGLFVVKAVEEVSNAFAATTALMDDLRAAGQFL